jgi:multidrug efflux pump subunit AcrA (membrane-fusion protein)
VDLGETGKRYPAKVKAINAQVDAVSQSIELEGVVVGPAKGLLAGMSGTALFAEAQPAPAVLEPLTPLDPAQPAATQARSAK